MCKFLSLVLGMAGGVGTVLDAAPEAKPTPDYADVSYGPHGRHRLDVWLARADVPAPVLVFFHGGGFVTGDKSKVPTSLLNAALAEGISVVAANYRFSPEVTYPSHYLDCARALQFVRHQAEAWGIDPSRVALVGSSAGAGSALWIGFHEDLGDPANADPVLRESTRVTCVITLGAQPSYDPRVIRAVAGESAARHNLFATFYDLGDEERDSTRAHRLYREASAVTHLTPDDPPVLAYYYEAWAPVPAGGKAGQGIHHPNLGLYLAEKMAAVDVECTVLHKSEARSVLGTELNFLRRHLGLEECP